IINLATQALIAARSKAKYYNPHALDEHVPVTLGTDRDEIGLICAIVVKERSSSQCKELFKTIQRRGGTMPIQLLLNMKSVDTFVYEMGCLAGEESLEKCRKIDSLHLSTAEWGHVQTFTNLLATAEKAQQAFSSSTVPMLCNAVPALEKLYTTWEKQQEQPEAAPFQDAIDAAMEKINQYYEKTAESDAHIMAMREY
ncbi:hypothetical protein BYT27DRAFT_7092899, partial [Phlegmacium glaucopus]